MKNIRDRVTSYHKLYATGMGDHVLLIATIDRRDEHIYAPVFFLVMNNTRHHIIRNLPSYHE